MIAPAAPPSAPGPRPWWEGRPFVVAMIILAFVPLLYPQFPPLVDLPGHMARFKVAIDVDTSPFLSEWYSFRWLPIGNLGVDILAIPLAKLLGVELATKWIVMLTPPLTVAGMLWVAREVHNRLPPTVAFALPLAFGHPFMFGFLNFSLSMALAMLAFGLWLRLGRLGKPKLRAMLFVPISFIVFFAHTFGWGTLGLLCFSAEAVRQHDRGWSWWKAGLRAAFHAAAMALPALLMVMWRTGASGGVTKAWFAWSFKLEYFERALRDRWEWFDLAALGIVVLVPVVALFHRRLVLSRNLAFSGLMLAACFVLLPRIIFGSAYADMRLVPYVLAIFILAIRFKAETTFPLARILALAGLAFLLARTAGTTASLAIAADHQRRQLTVLEAVPMGSRVVSLVWAPCGGWAMRRGDHLPSMVIVRREGFSNDQWPLAGSSLLTTRYPEAGWFKADPSGVVRSEGCRREGVPIALSLRSIPRDAFDYLWLVDFPPTPRALVAGWEPVAIAPGSLLLRRTASPPPDAEAPRLRIRRTETAIGR
ncbi:MAG: hypothetical protein M3Q83_00815 [Pseudomonadota bacterium]|nr:hypothetical protein [Pseudomonadota bacterium]